MEKNNLYTNIIFFIALAIFSITVNIHYGNIGLFPMDTFAFFDTAYSILLNKHPFKDIWITTGPFVDYTQAIFFKLFGLVYILDLRTLTLLFSLNFLKNFDDLI